MGTGEYSFSPVQLTTSRIGNLTRLIHTLLYVMAYIHTESGLSYYTKLLQVEQSNVNHILLFLFVCISLMADGPQRATGRLPISPPLTLPSCLWSLRIFLIFPGSLPRFLSQWKSSTLTTRQPMVEFYLLTFPRFLLRVPE